jgi:peptidoglycan hydrolase-like protein with peptidoglycan-binding domain
MNKTISLTGMLGAMTIAAILLIGNAGQAFAATVFTRDLTLGSSGSDVTSLQTFLIGQGFTIPAGATGYFGMQTKAALASYQAAHGIAPAAGYFGPVTRADVNTSDTDSGSGSNGQTDNGSSLSGGEATLRSFDLSSDNDLAEGETGQEIAVAEFDVKGGDVRVQRMTLEFTANNTGLSTLPWKYVDTIDVYDGSKKVGSADVSSKNDWDRNGTTYSVDVPLNAIVKGGRSAEFSIRADAQDNIDTANLGQTFSIIVPKNCFRAVDAKNIQQYTGSDSDAVTLGFDGADNGKLSVRESSDNPEAGVIVADDRDASDKTDVLSFELRNSNDADVALNELTVRVDAGFAGSSVANEDVDDIIRRATLKLDGKTYQGKVSDADSGTYEGSITFKNLKTVVDGDDTADGVLTVELYGSDNHFDSGATLAFDLLSTDIDAEGDRTGDAAEVTGSVRGNEMTVTTDAGINLGGRTNTATVYATGHDISSSYGTYSIKFDVTATGDDVYVPRTIAVNDSASTTAGVNIALLNDAFSGSSSAVLTSTAKTYSNDFFVVREGDTKTFTVTLVLEPDAAGYYSAGIDFVQFSPSSPSLSALQKLEVDQNKSQFRTDPLYIPN